MPPLPSGTEGFGGLPPPPPQIIGENGEIKLPFEDEESFKTKNATMIVELNE